MINSIVMILGWTVLLMITGVIGLLLLAAISVLIDEWRRRY